MGFELILQINVQRKEMNNMRIAESLNEVKKKQLSFFFSFFFVVVCFLFFWNSKLEKVKILQEYCFLLK